MEADDLHVVELVTWPNGKNLLPKTGAAKIPLVRFDDNRYYHLSAGVDARGGGMLLFYNLPQPLDLEGSKGEFPPQHDSIAGGQAAPRRLGRRRQGL